MITSAEMLLWTGLTVTQSDIDSYYEPVCTIQLQADGGDAFPESIRKQALCYLIASKIQAKDTNNQFSSEHLGSYSYSRKSSSTINYWIDLYNDILNSILSKDGVPSLIHGNDAERVDKHLISLNRRYI